MKLMDMPMARLNALHELLDKMGLMDLVHTDERNMAKNKKNINIAHLQLGAMRA